MNLKDWLTLFQTGAGSTEAEYNIYEKQAIRYISHTNAAEFQNTAEFIFENLYDIPLPIAVILFKRWVSLEPKNSEAALLFADYLICHGDEFKEEADRYYRIADAAKVAKIDLKSTSLDKYADKISTLRELSTRRSLLIREQFELEYLEKLQVVNSLEKLELLENELHNAVIDADLKTRLVKYTTEKKGFY